MLVGAVVLLALNVSGDVGRISSATHPTPPTRSNPIQSSAGLGLFAVNEVVDSEVLAICSSARVLHLH